MLLSMAMSTVRDSCTRAIPIALVKKGSTMQALTTKPVESGELVIPLFFKRQSSMAIAGEPGTTLHPKAVCCSVSWAQTPTDEEIAAGVEGKGEIHVPVHVQPELKLPNKTSKGEYDWGPSVALHPFWFIKRADKNDEPNAEIKVQDVTHVTACSFKPLSDSITGKMEPATDTYSVSIPIIVNTKALDANTEVILKHAPRKEEKRKKEPKLETAFDQLAQQDRKKRKTKPTVED